MAPPHVRVLLGISQSFSSSERKEAGKRVVWLSTGRHTLLPHSTLGSGGKPEHCCLHSPDALAEAAAGSDTYTLSSAPVGSPRGLGQLYACKVPPPAMLISQPLTVLPLALVVAAKSSCLRQRRRARRMRKAWLADT